MTTPPSSSPVYNGRYELRSQIGRGGTAQVYRAQDLLLDRPVALKVLIPELSSDHSFVDRFRREAQAAANLSHPNIVSVFDWGESESTYFIVMEFVDGEPLSSIIRTQAPLGPAHTAAIGADIAKALSFAHRHGVVHRDVKPGNVLITSDGQVKVTDFGIARAIGGGDEQVTQTGLVMGTATYFSPEQAQGFEVDGRSDVYSLGVVLYEMATGRPPFSGENPVSIAYQHVREEPPTPRSINPDTPPALEAIIAQAMAKLPAQRYANAEELRADLDRFVRGQTVLATPPPPAGDSLTTAIPSTPAGGPGGPGGPASPVDPQDDDYQPRSATPAWIASGAVLLIGILLIGFFGGRALGYFGGSQFIKVPDVTGKNVISAQQQLHKVGLDTVIKHVAGNATDKQGTVLEQNPTVPATLTKGGAVTLDVAGTPPRVQIPNVVNVSLESAESTLQGAGFKSQVKSVKAANSNQTQGEVIRQSPVANQKKSLGFTVTLFVVKGSKQVTVPTFLANGQPESGEQATEQLSKAGLSLGQTIQQFSTTVPNGDVISSNPTSGTSVSPGTSVDLVIAQQGVQVPDLRGYSLQAAETTLTQLGLTAVQGAPIQTSVAGQVGNVAFDSHSGQIVAPGTQIKLRIGVAAPGVTTTTTTPFPTTTTTTLPQGPPPA